MADEEKTRGQRFCYFLIGLALVAVCVGLLTAATVWFSEGHYEYVIFNGMMGIALGIIGVDCIIDAFA